jgi:hypothetical protein
MRWIWTLVAVGIAARLVIAFTTDGVAFDLGNFQRVSDALESGTLHVYGTVNFEEHQVRWPYPPAYFPLIWLTDQVSELTGLSFQSLIRLPAILADAGIALLVQDYLRRIGAADGLRVLATALIMLTPSFAMVSGFQGQIDAVAILPAVAAVYLWDLGIGGTRRALYAGILIGVGAAVKTVPILLLLALLPRVRSPREAAILVTSAVAVPLAMLAPFLVADGDAVMTALRYKGIPGFGGISLLVQLDAPSLLLLSEAVDYNAAFEWLLDHGRVVTMLGLGGLCALLLRARPPVVVAATLVWLTVFVFGVNLLLQYLVWGLPFLLMSGYVRWVLVLLAALVVPTVIAYLGPWESSAVVSVYTSIMLAVWAAFVVALAVLGRRALRLAAPTGERPPAATR